MGYKAHIKIVLLGDGAVGKTSIAKRYLRSGFSHEYKQTIGVDVYAKNSVLDIYGYKVDISWVIWDLAGQPKFREVRKDFYKGAKGAVLVFDISRRSTFNNVINWANEFMSNSGKYPVVLVGNKIDLRDKVSDPVTKEEGEKLAKSLSKMFNFDVPYIESSALLDINIDDIFNSLGFLILGRFFKRRT